MSEGFLGVLTAPWAPAIAAYLFGMATGWLIWGGRRLGPDAKMSGDLAVEPPADAPVLMKLGAAESELKNARDLVEEADAEARELAAEISTIDDAVKRANGRIKIVIDAVKKAGRR